MKKFNNKGQVLIETLVTSVMIVGVLVYVFIQLRSVASNYNKTSHYNSVNALYAADSFRAFLFKDNFYGADGTGTTSGLLYYYRNKSNSATDHYLDLSDCCGGGKCDSTTGDDSTNGIINTGYCQSLLSDLKIKQVIMTMENTSTLISSVDNVSILDDGFKTFIKYQKYDSEDGVYRIFIETTDGDFASVKLKK
jgi:hypothetical protein